MAWLAPTFTGGITWEDFPNETTPLNASDLNTQENAEATYAAAVGQSVVNYFESGGSASVVLINAPNTFSAVQTVQDQTNGSQSAPGPLRVIGSAAKGSPLYFDVRDQVNTTSAYAGACHWLGTNGHWAAGIDDAVPPYYRDFYIAKYFADGTEADKIFIRGGTVWDSSSHDIQGLNGPRISLNTGTRITNAGVSIAGQLGGAADPSLLALVGSFIPMTNPVLVSTVDGAANPMFQITSQGGLAWGVGGSGYPRSCTLAQTTGGSIALGTTCTYQITATTASGESYPLGQSPLSPLSITLTGSNNAVQLSWTTPANSIPTITGYKIYAKYGGGTMGLITTVAGGTTTYTDTGGAPTTAPPATDNTGGAPTVTLNYLPASGGLSIATTQAAVTPLNVAQNSASASLPALTVTQAGAANGMSVTMAAAGAGKYAALFSGYDAGAQIFTSASTGGIPTLFVNKTGTGGGIGLQVTNKGTGPGFQIDAGGSALLQVLANGQIKFAASANEATGSGSAALGSNCPATTLTAPYTWEKVTTSDGSQGYIPVWK